MAYLDQLPSALQLGTSKVSQRCESRSNYGLLAQKKKKFSRWETNKKRSDAFNTLANEPRHPNISLNLR